MLLDLLRQDVLGETLDKRISKYFKVGKAAEIFSNKLLANHAFMTPIATYVQRKATESFADHRLAATLERALTMKNDKLQDVHTTTAALPKPVFPPSRTESDIEETSDEDRSRRKSSRKRCHNRHRKQDKGSSSSLSRSHKSRTGDSDSDSERRRVRDRRKNRLSRASSAERDVSRSRHCKHRDDKDDSLKVLRPVNDRFREALDYHNYRLADQSSKYNEDVAKSVAKWAKRLQVQMRSNTFDSFDPYRF